MADASGLAYNHEIPSLNSELLPASRLLADLDPAAQRQFAVNIIERLRAANYQAYWAGGCVRDQLLARTPKDYDVATSALPNEIRALFGHRRTLAIGAAFGVITVLGERAAGPIEVATFRRDMGYSDGRRPDAVAFSTAEEDAQRRDFTINGLFYDPLADQVLDYVDGQADLGRRVIRAIGDPFARFQEDKLRLLRAIRFAAKFDFALEPATRAAIVAMAPEAPVVSPERIAAELRAMLTHASRATATRLLAEVGLLTAILPEWSADALGDAGGEAIKTLERLEADASFALALAALLGSRVSSESVAEICRRLRLSNRDIDRSTWLVAQRLALVGAQRQPWPRVQRILTHGGSAELLELHRAAAVICDEDWRFCQEVLARPRAAWDPAPLINGDDLLKLGIPAGKHFQSLLEQVRDAQLEGRVTTCDQALQLARSLWPPQS
jgi:tRNA nucleotidyltransferase/poly(A) polymerase